MTPWLQRLRAEMRSDRKALESRLDELRRLDLSGPSPKRGDIALAALALHHGYCSIESLLVRVSRALDGREPDVPAWHQTLLEAMGLDVDGVRPPVLGGETLALLHRILAFRHFLRHAYAVELDPIRLEALRQDALRLSPLLASDLDRFDAFLAGLGATPPSAGD